MNTPQYILLIFVELDAMPIGLKVKPTQSLESFDFISILPLHKRRHLPVYSSNSQGIDTII